MSDLHLSVLIPVLSLIACTASGDPRVRDKPAELAADDIDTRNLNKPPRVVRHDVADVAAVADVHDAAARARVVDTGLIGSGGGSTSRAEPSGYSGSRGFENFGGRGTRVPTVRLARPEVVGSLDKEIIRRTVNSHIKDVRRCQDLGLARDPNSKGRVTIEFEIDDKGKVTTATAQESLMKADDVPPCIAAAVLGWKFPRPKTGTVQVVYPFVLEPG